MARHRHREWKNNRDKNDNWKQWTCRCIWYEESEGSNIRLQMEDSERTVNYYPADSDEAEHVYFMFRQGAPKHGESDVNTPFLLDLLKLLAKKYEAAKRCLSAD